jgi:diguanylate cyclase (GGDEF)-like protein
MNYVLVLRAEIVCLIILIYLTMVSRTYRMGKDAGIFRQILFFAILHVVMDIVTVWTVNHTETVPLFWNNLAHIVFYLSAIMFSYAMCVYTLNLSRPQQLSLARRWLMLIPVGIYLILLITGVLQIEYIQLNGTRASAGPAAVAGYVIAFAYFAIGILVIFWHWKRIGTHFKKTMLPMLFMLIISELIQTQVKEFFFTGCAITVITVAFFFTLENPAAVLERKIMMDALSGLGTRSGYEHDMEEYDRMFEADKNMKFTFLFVDINNLKSVNGLYGHQEGDAYIANMAVLLVTNLQNAEHIYRMGGDEFLAIYRKTDEKTVVKDIERVQKVCSKEREKGYTPELAIGYAISDPNYNNLRDVLRVADYMMYRNKADIKREIAEGVIHHVGTRLNLSGLTDRIFDAMCLTSEEYYPYLTNMETNVTRVAPAMAEFFGLDSEFQDNFSEVWILKVHPDDRNEYIEDLMATMKGRKQYHFCKYRALGKDGNYVDVTCRGGIYHGRDGEPDIFAGYVVNHGATNRIDSATGLLTHHVLFERLDEAIREKRNAVVLRLAVRNLNRIRMLYSSEIAGMTIKNMAADFQKMIGENGEAFSSQGSNFILFLPDFDAARANELYGQIKRHCAAGILVGDAVIPVDLIGGAVLLPDPVLADPGEIRQATVFTIEVASLSNRNSLAFFTDSSDIRQGDSRDLLKAIHRDCVTNRSKFYLRFQPIVHAHTGQVAGAEALLRWKSEEFGEVSPSKFIGFLENDPAYEPLGYEIIREAVRRAGQFRKKIPDFRINVNITALQLLTEDFISNVQKILEEEQFDAGGLILELTERCKEMEFELLNQRVQELKNTGIRVALDDMGTGYSTIDLLLHLHANEIKLDMSFTSVLRGDENHELLASVLCETAQKRGIDICFEGVETEALLAYLKNYGDVLVQGYYFDKPLLPEEFEQKYCG